MSLVDKVRAIRAELSKPDSAFWRRAIDAGVTYGPDAWVRYSPPAFGLAFGAALPKQRRAVLRNVRRAAKPESALEAYLLAARVFVNFAGALTDAFIAGSDRGDRLGGSIRGDEHFLGALREGKGVIVATAHTGGWHAAGQMLREVHGADVLVVMQRERDARAEEVQARARDRAGIRVVYVEGSPLDSLHLLAHLRRRGVVAVQVDRVPAGMRARDVELFGEPWRVPEGPIVLAAVSGAPLLPVFARRLGYMRYEVTVAPAIRVPRRPTPEQLDEAARALAREVERFVRANPTQWFHFE